MSQNFNQEDFRIDSLGPCEYRTPVEGGYVTDSNSIRLHVEVSSDQPPEPDIRLEKAGPREHTYFSPPQTSAAVVTCGGLSPGLNNVIRSIYCQLHYNYQVHRVLGIRFGYRGMNPSYGLDSIDLDHDTVEDIDKLGGTILGSSRGPQPVEMMADYLVEHGINILFCVGGDGTQRGAEQLCHEINRRRLSVAVVGIPKTIDNDIAFVSQSFGYATALERATEVIKGAHVEARSAIHGVGLVKLMGRDAGFIAAGATLASQEVNFTLIPEVAFPLHGPGGFLPVLEERIRQRQHAVVVVAEGGGQHLFVDRNATDHDASGNLHHQDIGIHLKNEIISHFQSVNLPLTLKYLDPSYHIRAAPANTLDRILSDQMARLAVDAAMAGKTNMLLGHVNDHFVHVPIGTATAAKKQLNIDSDVWQAVLRETGQPRW